MRPDLGQWRRMGRSGQIRGTRQGKRTGLDGMWGKQWGGLGRRLCLRPHLGSSVLQGPELWEETGLGGENALGSGLRGLRLLGRIPWAVALRTGEDGRGTDCALRGRPPRGAVLTDHLLRHRDQSTGGLKTGNGTGFTPDPPSQPPRGSSVPSLVEGTPCLHSPVWGLTTVERPRFPPKPKAARRQGVNEASSSIPLIDYKTLLPDHSLNTCN